MDYRELSIKAPIDFGSLEFADRLYSMAPLAPAGLGRLLFRYSEDAGLRPDVIACLSMKETNRYRYGGTEVGFSADPTFNNFGGIKTTDGKATQRFLNVALGVRGLVAHFFWYASDTHVNSICGVQGIGQSYSEFDPRHFQSGHTGRLKKVGDLGNGIWNGTPTYYEGVVRLLEEFWS